MEALDKLMPARSRRQHIAKFEISNFGFFFKSVLLTLYCTLRFKVNSETRDPAPAKRPSKAPRHVSRVATKGDASVNTRFKGVETRLERENRRLREQLKFQVWQIVTLAQEQTCRVS